MKTCTNCGELKDLSEFDKAKKNKDGLNSKCKECRSIQRLKRLNRTESLIRINKSLLLKGKKICYVCKIEQDENCFYLKKGVPVHSCKNCMAENKKTTHYKEQRKIQRKKYSNRFKSAISLSKRRGLKFTLTAEQFIELIDKPCYYCYNLLGRKVEASTGLDRLDSSKGYVTGNCVSCCKTCNQTKMDTYTPEETQAMIHLVMKMRGIIFG